MILRATLFAAAVLASAPALAATPSKAERDAITRCTMKQLHQPAGRGIGGHHANCAQVARAELAAREKRQELASRAAATTEGRD